ncbi:hypothetical protein [Vulcanococcus limneticus]|uniref:hypothetical protein n=1 Tax=Vulcanococcus limneticus TaxID=2170428 RepID=UPI00398C20EB
MNRQGKYWLALISAIVVVVGLVVYVSRQNQERLTTEAQTQEMRDLADRQDLANRQDLASREEMGRQLSDSALRNELDSASRRESALQAQLTAMDVAARNRAADAQQQAKRQQAEQELRDLRAQRAQLQKQVNCERIQLSMNQLEAKGNSDQVLSLQKQWTVACPNLRTGG